MVPKGGFEPPRGSPTTPSRWRVYQFHHFGFIYTLYFLIPPNLTLYRKEKSHSLQRGSVKNRHSSVESGWNITSSVLAPGLQVEPESEKVLLGPIGLIFLSLLRKLVLSKKKLESER
jgi:hypothetical protein